MFSGAGAVRHEEGTTPISPGDSFIFPPGQAHQLLSDPAQDLLLYIIAVNPIGEAGYYPDGRKWIVRSPDRRLLRSEALDYLDGEE